MKKKLRIVISGGGTGGHIFPAIAIANAIKKIDPKARFLFVGAEGRMEMERVPQAGYTIVGLPVRGFNRAQLWKNISVVWDLMKSLVKARKTIQAYKPDVVVGVGGYASGPTLKMANMLGIPTVIQEQNSYAGVTNKLLAKDAAAICVAYPDMERFFPKERIVLTGNPIRQDLIDKQVDREEAYAFFGLDPKKKTLLIIGGSLGARTINESIERGLAHFERAGVQVIWQTGKNFTLSQGVTMPEHVKQMAFISRMDLAYAVADLVVSRAGASSISELCLLEKAVILVPSPNVAEDHQTKNARALSDHGAAVFVSDKDAHQQLVDSAIRLIGNEKALVDLRATIAQFALHQSAEKIAAIVLEQAHREK